MTKNTITRPNLPRGGGAKRAAEDAAQQQAQQDGGTKKSSSSKAASGPSLASKLRAQAAKKNQQTKKADKAQSPKAPKVSRPRGAHGAHAAGGHDDHHDDGEAHGLGGVDAASNEDELHRRRHVEMEYVHEDEEVEEHEDVHETAAVSVDGVKRGKNDNGGGDGFEGGGDKQREAYERYMRGNVKSDKERFDELRSKGTRDDFNPELQAPEVEALGVNRATAHVVRIYEKWTLEGVPREEAVQRAASLLAGFTSVTNIRKVLAELESKPIRDVYPLEVLMKMLDERPELLPGVRPGSVIGNAADMRDGNKLLAGVPMTIPLPGDVRLKSFALLGGARPGYEFAPHAHDEGKYTLLVDTPGRWTFAVLAAPLQQLGRIQRETNEAILELFTVAVHAMGVKGEPLTPEQWDELQLLEAAANGDDVDDIGDDEGESPDSDEIRDIVKAPAAPNLPVQIRKALDLVTRDPESTTTATTYSWNATFYKPGAPMEGEGILHLVVERAGPFDQAWVKAREALANKQKEYEPGRAGVTGEDFTAALRRARVR